MCFCTSLDNASVANNRWREALCGQVFRPSGRPLTSISRDAISLYFVEEFQWNLPQIFIMWVGIAGKVFKVKGRGHREVKSTFPVNAIDLWASVRCRAAEAYRTDWLCGVDGDLMFCDAVHDYFIWVGLLETYELKECTKNLSLISLKTLPFKRGENTPLYRLAHCTNA